MYFLTLLLIAYNSIHAIRQDCDFFIVETHAYRFTVVILMKTNALRQSRKKNSRKSSRISLKLLSN